MSTDACQNVESAEENEVLRAWKLHMEQVKNQPENLNAELLWQMLCELQKIPFYTVKGGAKVNKKVFYAKKMWEYLFFFDMRYEKNRNMPACITKMLC